MKKVILASGNKHKLEEIQEILKDYKLELQTMHDAGLVDYEIIEDGETFEENSLIKAKAVMDELGIDTIADDSGLEVDALNGAPGVYSARYAGESADPVANNEKLLKALKDVPDEKRTARFVTVLTMLFKNGHKIVVRGEVVGRIGYEAKGTNGFGYDPLFVVPELGKTFAELESHEKNALSHRANALKLLKVELDKYLEA
ncbi:XTP/dITP diphosphatase [Fusibacter sp. JL216-2]|uniref:XTP/dITP diphosphatase n=1 Tax=Fusibacter sp. JL216-2 TaxID=3071453 RepID=UPI003D340B84